MQQSQAVIKHMVNTFTNIVNTILIQMPVYNTNANHSKSLT